MLGRRGSNNHPMNQTTRSVKLSAKQSSRLAAYFAAGVAASMATTSESEGAIVYFNVDPDKTINSGESMSFGNINLSNGTYTFNSFFGESFELSLQNFGAVSLYNGYGSGSINWGLNGGYDVLKLESGDPISSAITQWNNGYGYLTKNGNGPWTSGGDAYAALRISAGGSDYNYGWVNINFDALTPTATITGFAFETTANTPIAAGAVPEPSTVALAGVAALILGGSAYVRSRRRREEEQKEAA